MIEKFGWEELSSSYDIITNMFVYYIKYIVDWKSFDTTKPWSARELINVDWYQSTKFLSFYKFSIDLGYHEEPSVSFASLNEWNNLVEILVQERTSLLNNLDNSYVRAQLPVDWSRKACNEARYEREKYEKNLRKEKEKLFFLLHYRITEGSPLGPLNKILSQLPTVLQNAQEKARSESMLSSSDPLL